MLTLKDASPLAISLRQAGFETCSYHGPKMLAHDKLQSMESWRNGTMKIMVCTTAFGMGIVQPDVEVILPTNSRIYGPRIWKRWKRWTTN